jgi:hypothetical protein
MPARSRICPASRGLTREKWLAGGELAVHAGRRDADALLAAALRRRWNFEP